MKLMKHWRRLFGRNPSSDLEDSRDRGAIVPSFFATGREVRMWLRTPFLPVARGRQEPAFMDTEPGIAAFERKA